MRKKKVKRKSKKNKAKKILIVFLVILCSIIGYLYYYLHEFSIQSKAGEGNIVVNETQKVEDGKPVNILVMGVDIGDPKLKGENVPKRTDTIILMNYNPVNEQVNLVSIPRDTKVMVNGRTQKINAAHAIGGVDSLIKSVTNLLHLNINYYAKINYEGFRNVIDSIGGVDMEIKNNMYYDDASQNLHINFKKGETAHLDGKKAEEFFRWRKNNDGTGLAEGDIGRIENQHMFINKVIDKFKSASIIPRIPSIMNTLPKYIETNMEPEDIIKYSYLVTRLDKSQISINTLKGDGKYIGGISYFIYDKKANQNLISVLKGSSSNDVLNKEEIKIQVLNGTKINGLAHRISESLIEKGYKNVVTGNAEKTKETKLLLYGIDEKSISNIKSDFNVDNVEAYNDKDGEYDIKLLIGDDYNN